MSSPPCRSIYGPASTATKSWKLICSASSIAALSPEIASDVPKNQLSPSKFSVLLSTASQVKNSHGEEKAEFDRRCKSSRRRVIRAPWPTPRPGCRLPPPFSLHARLVITGAPRASSCVRAWLLVSFGVVFARITSKVHGFRPTDYLRRSSQERQLLAGRPQSISLAIGGQRADPPARAGIWRKTFRPRGESRAAHARGRGAARLCQ